MVAKKRHQHVYLSAVSGVFVSAGNEAVEPLTEVFGKLLRVPSSALVMQSSDDQSPRPSIELTFDITRGMVKAATEIQTSQPRPTERQALL